MLLILSTYILIFLITPLTFLIMVLIILILPFFGVLFVRNKNLVDIRFWMVVDVVAIMGYG